MGILVQVGEIDVSAERAGHELVVDCGDGLDRKARQVRARRRLPGGRAIRGTEKGRGDGFDLGREIEHLLGPGACLGGQGPLPPVVMSRHVEVDGARHRAPRRPGVAQGRHEVEGRLLHRPRRRHVGFQAAGDELLFEHGGDAAQTSLGNGELHVEGSGPEVGGERVWMVEGIAEGKVRKRHAHVGQRSLGVTHLGHEVRRRLPAVHQGVDDEVDAFQPPGRARVHENAVDIARRRRLRREDEAIRVDREGQVRRVVDVAPREAALQAHVAAGLAHGEVLGRDERRRLGQIDARVEVEMTPGLPPRGRRQRTSAAELHLLRVHVQSPDAGGGPMDRSGDSPAFQLRVEVSRDVAHAAGGDVLHIEHRAAPCGVAPQVHVHIERDGPRLERLLDVSQATRAAEVDSARGRANAEPSRGERGVRGQGRPETLDARVPDVDVVAAERRAGDRHARLLAGARQRGLELSQGKAAFETHVPARVDVGRIGAADGDGHVRARRPPGRADDGGGEVLAARVDVERPERDVHLRRGRRAACVRIEGGAPHAVGPLRDAAGVGPQGGVERHGAEVERAACIELRAAAHGMSELRDAIEVLHGGGEIECEDRGVAPGSNVDRELRRCAGLLDDDFGVRMQRLGGRSRCRCAHRGRRRGVLSHAAPEKLQRQVARQGPVGGHGGRRIAGQAQIRDRRGRSELVAVDVAGLDRDLHALRIRDRGGSIRVDRSGTELGVQAEVDVGQGAVGFGVGAAGLVEGGIGPEAADIVRCDRRCIAHGVHRVVHHRRADRLGVPPDCAVPCEVALGMDLGVRRHLHVRRERAGDVGSVRDAARGDRGLRDGAFEDIGGVCESAAEAVEIDVERRRARHLPVRPAVGEREVVHLESHAPGVRIGRGAWLGRRECVHEVEVARRVGVEAHVQRVDRDVRQLDCERPALGEQGRTNRPEGADTDAHPGRREHGAPAGIDDRDVRAGEAEDTQPAQLLDPDLPLEGGRQDRIDLRHGDAARPGRPQMEQHSQDDAEHEDDRSAENLARDDEPADHRSAPRRAARYKARTCGGATGEVIPFPRALIR